MVILPARHTSPNEDSEIELHSSECVDIPLSENAAARSYQYGLEFFISSVSDEISKPPIVINGSCGIDCSEDSLYTIAHGFLMGLVLKTSRCAKNASARMLVTSQDGSGTVRVIGNCLSPIEPFRQGKAFHFIDDPNSYWEKEVPNPKENPGTSKFSLLAYETFDGAVEIVDNDGCLPRLTKESVTAKDMPDPELIRRKGQGRRKRVSEDKPLNDSGYVYLMKCGSDYKIGKTNNIKTRMYQIGIKMPEPLELLHLIKTDTPLSVERFWHMKYDACRKRGEWFSLTPEQVEEFKEKSQMTL